MTPDAAADARAAGEVKTDINVACMNWGPGTIPAEESAKGILAQLGKLDISSTDKGILSYDGTVFPW